MGGKKIPVRKAAELTSEPMRPMKKPEPRSPVSLGDLPINASLRVYKRIAVSFVILVTLVLIAVVYVSTVQATIHVKPVAETVSNEILLDVVATPTHENEIRGKVASGSLSKTQTVKASGQEATQVDGIATGVVTVFNKGSKDQPLVATTRLLTSDNVLFRIDSTVTVPAGGQVDVKAHADLKGATGDVKPTKFTIPGLSASLQSVIYAENKAAFTGGVQSVVAISQSDIDKALADLKAAIEADAKEMLRAQIGETFSGESFTSTVTAQKSSVAAGSQAESFDVTMTVQVVGVFFDREAAIKLITMGLYGKLGTGREFAKINTDGLSVTLDKVDLATGSVNVRVYEDALAITSNTSRALDPGRFAGMSGEEVRKTLIDEGVAEDVTVEFFPPWTNRVPSLKDHINVVIE